MPVVLSTMDRRIIGLAVPALGALIVEPLYNLTDTAIVGHLGRSPLAALALATTVLNLLGWTFGFLQMATTSRVAVRRGQDDLAGASAAAVAGYLVAVALGIGVAALVGFAGPALAHLLGGHGTVQHDATTYLRISALGMPFLLITLAGTGHLQGEADTRTPLLIVLVANLANIALELLLVYGLDLGIAGSAWGTVAAQVIAASLFLAVGVRRTARHRRRPPLSDYVTLLRNGVALVIRTIALGSALVASTAIAAQVGTATLAGHQIALQIWILLALTLDALAVPAQVYVGTALGRNDTMTAAEVGRRCLLIGVVISAAIGLVTMALAPLLPSLFSSDGAVQDAATTGLLLCGAQQPLAAIAFVLDGLLLGAEDYATLRRSMVLALLAFAPFAVATLAHHSLGIAGIWLALTCWLAARCALLGRAWWVRTHL